MFTQNVVAREKNIFRVLQKKNGDFKRPLITVQQDEVSQNRALKFSKFDKNGDAKPGSFCDNNQGRMILHG